MEAHSLEKITMNNYMGKLKFPTFLELHSGDRFPHFKFHPWDKILDEVRTRYHVGASRERRLPTTELHEKVPSLMQVQEMNIRVQEFLNKDLSEKNSSSQRTLCPQFFNSFIRFNCRAGPLLNLTSEDVETIKKVGSLDTDKHNSRYYDSNTARSAEMVEEIEIKVCQGIQSGPDSRFCIKCKYGGVSNLFL